MVHKYVVVFLLIEAVVSQTTQETTLSITEESSTLPNTETNKKDQLESSFSPEHTTRIEVTSPTYTTSQTSTLEHTSLPSTITKEDASKKNISPDQISLLLEAVQHFHKNHDPKEDFLVFVQRAIKQPESETPSSDKVSSLLGKLFGTPEKSKDKKEGAHMEIFEEPSTTEENRHRSLATKRGGFRMNMNKSRKEPQILVYPKTRRGSFRYRSQQGDDFDRDSNTFSSSLSPLQNIGRKIDDYRVRDDYNTEFQRKEDRKRYQTRENVQARFDPFRSRKIQEEFIDSKRQTQKYYRRHGYNSEFQTETAHRYQTEENEPFSKQSFQQYSEKPRTQLENYNRRNGYRDIQTEAYDQRYQGTQNFKPFPIGSFRKPPKEPRREVENSRYSFASDVQDDINGNLHQRQETRDGNRVTGSYTYEDGFVRRTVHYVADEKGYRVIKQEVDEIGQGPHFNPSGSAKVRSYVAGQEVDYQIRATDSGGRPQEPYRENGQDFGHYQWRY